MNLIDLLDGYKTISIIGMAKNSGKTTVLNHLLSGLKGQTIGLTSIGRDGEDLDVVTRTPKPRIFVPAGTIIATAQELLKYCDISAQILATTGFATPMGDVYIVRANRGGAVQIGGASMVMQMAELLPIMRRFGAGKIIVDGAISRKSLATPKIADGVVLCTGAALSKDMDEVIAQTKHVVEILSLRNAGCGYGVEIDGALTDSVIEKYLYEGKVLVADNASKILVSPQAYKKLKIKGGALAVKTPINLAALCINPTAPKDPSFNAQEFLVKMQSVVNIPVFDVVLTTKQKCDKL